MSGPHYRLAPLCMAVSVQDFRAWQAKALPGARMIYAQGPALDQQRDVVVLARECAEIGTVTLLRRRDPVSGGFEFIAERLADWPPLRSAAPAGKARTLPAPDSELGRVLEVLMRHANMDLPCPSNAELARALKLQGAEAVRYLIGQLIEGGNVRMDNRGPRIARIATITATGKSTSARMIAVGKGFAGMVR